MLQLSPECLHLLKSSLPCRGMSALAWLQAPVPSPCQVGHVRWQANIRWRGKCEAGGVMVLRSRLIPTALLIMPFVK